MQHTKTTWAGITAAIGATMMSVGCGGLQPPLSAPGAMYRTPALAPSSPNYRVVYSFKGPPDGNTPLSPLVYVGGTLYGTTNSGGSYDCNDSTFYYGCGTVYSLSTGGREKVLHVFTIGDGAIVDSGLIDVKGTLYGTTRKGGAGYGGTVFSVSTDGSERVVHNFHHTGVSQEPVSGLINVNGMLYGGTSYRDGTAFAVTTLGAFNTLYRFKGGSDAADPSGRLVDVDGTLYGLSNGGDACASRYNYSGSCGTVYSLTRKGAEKVLYWDGPDFMDTQLVYNVDLRSVRD